MATPFTWDTRKAAGNLQKHGVSFEEARTVFDNPLAVIFDDEAHSTVEPREIVVGHSASGRLLLVCFTERADGVRIINARCATPKERDRYEQGANV